MRVLESIEIQEISGGGIGAAILALPVAMAVGIGTTFPALFLGAPLVFLQAKTYKEGFKNAAYQTTLGFQIGIAIEKAAYNW